MLYRDAYVLLQGGTIPMTTPARLKTVPEVATALRVSTHAVYRWVAEGRLTAVRVGALLRFTDAAIDDFISGKQQRRS
jgi:excisionase family DNA binding protein